MLGAAMLSRPALSEALNGLSDHDFFQEKHRLIFASLRAVAAATGAVDPITVASHLREQGHLTAIGGSAYLHALVAGVPTTSNAAHYVWTVADLSRRRLLLEVVAQAPEIIRSQGSADAALDELAARLRFIPRADQAGVRLLSIEDLRAMPAPVDLVESVMSCDSLVTLWGPSGHGKSLLALDLGLTVSLGDVWFGNRAVEAGPVVLVAAEGVTATARRIDAWLDDRGRTEPKDFYVVAEAVNLFSDSDPQSFVRAVEQFSVSPRLVIFDTLARSMVGADENSARDLGVVIAAADWVRSRSGATVLVVHHSGRNGEHERGSTALYAASDTVISAIRNDDGVVEVQSRKQKGREDFATFGLSLRTHAGSVVLDPSDLLPSDPAKPPDTATALLAALWQSFGSKPASSTAWRLASGTPERTYYRAKKWLVDNGYVAESGTQRRPMFTITEKGEQWQLP